MPEYAERVRMKTRLSLVVARCPSWMAVVVMRGTRCTRRRQPDGGLKGGKLTPVRRLVQLRFGRVEPKAVDSLGEERRVDLLPIEERPSVLNGS